MKLIKGGGGYVAVLIELADSLRSISPGLSAPEKDCDSSELLLVVKGHAERTVRISSAVSPGLSAPERVCDSSELPTGGQRAC